MQVGIVGGNSPVSFGFGDWYGACPYSVPGKLSRLEENNQ
jgi:hypothetical protein